MVRFGSLCLVVVLVVAGCGDGDPEPSPSASASASRPAGPAFAGRLLMGTDGSPTRLWEMKPAEPGRLSITPVLTGTNITLSPDRRRALYFSDGRVMVHDLGAAAGRPLTGPGFDRCLEWSPDSQRFSVQAADDTIYVGDLAGRVLPVHQPKIGEMTGLFGGPRIPVNTDLACGGWLAPDRFVIHRFGGPVPEVEQVYGNRTSIEKAIDTTTVVVLSGTAVARMVDSPKGRRWFVNGLCGQWTMLRDYDSSYLVGALTDEMVTSEAAFTAAARIDGSADKDIRTMLVPGTCELVQLAPTGVRFLDPATRQVVRSLPPRYVAQVPVVWSPETGRPVLAWTILGSIELLDLNTGGTTRLRFDSPTTATTTPYLAAWLP